ncbi:MAG: isochorismatase family protein [Gammaproteobacteria bacterium]|jgi:maleamate amidohydrolase|nr:isochorismatase family protein [Gammaproteobacteria bacterium]
MAKKVGAKKKTEKSAVQNYAGVWDNRIGFGKKPAVVVIDLLQGYTLPGAPLFAPGVVKCVKEVPELLKVARTKKVPVIHTRVLYNPSNFEDGGVWIRKAPVLKALVPGNKYAEFCPGVKPARGETVIVKNYASCFFGTSLAATLTAQGVDTLIITGCTTSGCIRASAVDAVQHGFRPIVVRECVGDRHDGPHEANLFDINAKYGDVVSKAEVIRYLNSLR